MRALTYIIIAAGYITISFAAVLVLYVDMYSRFMKWTTVELYALNNLMLRNPANEKDVLNIVIVGMNSRY